MLVHEYVKKRESRSAQGLSAVKGSPGDAPEQMRKIPSLAPFLWLKKGVSDVRASRYLSLFYGVCFVLMGLGIDRAHADRPIVAMGLSAGFLFAGPFLAIGLYELSRQHQAGEKVDFMLSLFSWCRNPASVGRFALLLSIVMVFWLWLSVTLQDVFTQGPSFRLFGVLIVWAILALIVFMSSVVAIPMMLDKPVNTRFGIASSVRCCLANPASLSLWAVIIAVLVTFSLSLGYWPLLVTGPVLGHASWHAYQAGLSVNIAQNNAGDIEGGTSDQR
jgi:uncharacterized membrane protein